MGAARIPAEGQTPIFVRGPALICSRLPPLKTGVGGWGSGSEAWLGQARIIPNTSPLSKGHRELGVTYIKWRSAAQVQGTGWEQVAGSGFPPCTIRSGNNCVYSCVSNRYTLDER